MMRCSELIIHPDHRLRMVAVRRAWAHEWRRQGRQEDSVWSAEDCEQLAKANFASAQMRLREVRK